MDFKSGCLICGQDLVYSEAAVPAACFYCGIVEETNAVCREKHYICDACHSRAANDAIETFCLQSASTDPMAVAMELMRNRLIHMHGPEHHFLIPAALLTAWCNLKEIPLPERMELLKQARKRSSDIKGGFCGFHGACGAAIGTGIFISVITQSTPCSGMEWRLSNRMTAESLRQIAEHGGPRCCKRNTRIAIHCAVQFLEKELGVAMPVGVQPPCAYTPLNKECLKAQCPFFDEGLPK